MQRKLFCMLFYIFEIPKTVWKNDSFKFWIKNFFTFTFKLILFKNCICKILLYLNVFRFYTRIKFVVGFYMYLLNEYDYRPNLNLYFITVYFMLNFDELSYLLWWNFSKTSFFKNDIWKNTLCVQLFLEDFNKPRK